MAITKDLVRRIGWPEEWLNNDDAMKQAAEETAQTMQEQQAMSAAAGVAEGAGKAAPMVKALADAQRARAAA
jgi:hypothetical protein